MRRDPIYVDILFMGWLKIYFRSDIGIGLILNKLCLVKMKIYCNLTVFIKGSEP